MRRVKVLNWLGKAFDIDNSVFYDYFCDYEALIDYGPHLRAALNGQVGVRMKGYVLFGKYRLTLNNMDTGVWISDTDAGGGHQMEGCNFELTANAIQNSTYSGTLIKHYLGGQTEFHINSKWNAIDVGWDIDPVNATASDSCKLYGAFDGAIPLAWGAAIPAGDHGGTLMRMNADGSGRIAGRGTYFVGQDGGGGIANTISSGPVALVGLSNLSWVRDLSAMATISSVHSLLGLNANTQPVLNISATAPGSTISEIGYVTYGLDFTDVAIDLVCTGPYGFVIEDEYTAASNSTFRINTLDRYPLVVPYNSNKPPCKVRLKRNATNTRWNVERVSNGLGLSSAIQNSASWLAYLDASVGVKTAGGVNVVSVKEQDSGRLLTTAGGSPTLVQQAFGNGRPGILTSTPATLSDVTSGVWGALNGSSTPFIFAIRLKLPSASASNNIVEIYASGGTSFALQLYYGATTTLTAYRGASGGSAIGLSKTVAVSGEYLLVYCLHNDGKLYLIDETGTSAGVTDTGGALTLLDTLSFNGKISAPTTNSGYIGECLVRLPIVAVNCLAEAQALRVSMLNEW
jgi:hypothetical protein